jgi:SEC-C motif-containing protein
MYITGEKPAPTAEILMRSRYTAYALHNSEYLLKTWDPNKRPRTIDFSKDQSEWQRLEIISTQKGQAKDSKGLVEFNAYYFLDGKQHILKEISRFKKQRGTWFYLDGAVRSIANNTQKSSQGLNAPCPCGSGKKFKRCCGKP